ncbi:MAG: PDZ domain-containing protein [Casimicrobiaceae bacterium]
MFIVDAMQFNRPLTGVAFTQPPPPKPDFAFPAGRSSVIVPIEVVDGHLFVRVRIDGKGPVRMLVDTSSINVLLPDVARALKLKAGPAAPGRGDGSVRVVRAGRMDIGGVVIDQPFFATFDLKAFLRRVEGVDDVAGIIGFEVLKRMPATIDYAAGKLTLHDPATYKFTGRAQGVPITFRGTMPQVKGRIDGIDGIFDIGTGARGSLTLAAPFVAANDLAKRYGAKQAVITGATPKGPVRGLLARAEELDIGGVAVAKPVAVLVTAPAATPGADADAGSIGYGVLRRFIPTFDYGRSVVYLEAAAAMAEADAFERAGLWLERGAKGFVVVDVVAGSPAAAAGLRAGETITAINGRGAGTMSLADARATLRGAAGTTVRLRAGPTGERTLILRDLI